MSAVPRVRIYHNSLWARYKGAIFSKAFALHDCKKFHLDFVHVAETSDKREALGPPDLSYHTYPYRLLFRRSSDRVPSFRLAVALIADLLRNKSELVVIPGYHRIEYWAMLLTCMLLRRKRAVFCDSTAIDNVKTRFKEMAKSFFFRHCHGFFCYGARSKKYIQSYGIDACLIHSPCQAAALPHDYDPNDVLQRYAGQSLNGGNSPTFLFVGRLAKEKGLEDLLAAFQRVHVRLPDAKLLIVGAGMDRAHLEAYAAKLGVAASVSLLGSQTPSQIAGMLEASAAMVLPSRQEPWGLVVNEALSYGCPVVVSDACGCVPELVLDGVTGFVFPAGDVEALSEAMHRAIALNDDRVGTARHCLEVISLYTPERAAAEILRGCGHMVGAN